MSVLMLIALSALACSLDMPDEDLMAARSWTLEGPEVRIGSVDDPEFAFGQVRSLAVAPDGSVISIHRQEATVYHVWGVESDELDVDYIVGYRIVR